MTRKTKMWDSTENLQNKISVNGSFFELDPENRKIELLNNLFEKQ